MDCPEKCEYLKAGRERETADYGKRLRTLDEAARERSIRVLTDHHEVVSHLEYAISRERLQLSDLADTEVAEAIDILLQNYATEDRGILYDRPSDNLRVDYLRRELKKVIEAHRNPEGGETQGIVDPKATRLQLHAAIECLEFIRSVIATYLEERHSTSSYVDFLARVTPREDARSSIIMP